MERKDRDVESAVEIDQLDPAAADDAELAGYHAVVAASHQVDYPDDPPLPVRELVARLRQPLPGMGSAAHWVARSGGRIAGVVQVRFLEDENRGIGLAEVTVEPRSRRRGIGSALLAATLPELVTRERESVEAWQVVAGGAGQLWAEAQGFRPVRTITVQALAFPGADHQLWPSDAPSGYHLRKWFGPAPDDLVASYAAARGAIHDAPLGESDYRWPEWTVDRVRETESEWRSQGIEQRVVAAVAEATGEVAGFTETGVHPRRPEWAYQRDTAVFAAHRGHGLGRSVKGCMLRWLASERPLLERIQTTTGAENTHMISVNHELGFSTIKTVVVVHQNLAHLLARHE
jgi:mycothiol synthase